MLFNQFSSIEQLESFNQFLFDAKNYLKSKNADELEKHNFPSNIIEEINDILESVNKLKNSLKTGLADSSNIYSTSSDDYICKS